jgi:anti-sigma B factor antagonist
MKVNTKLVGDICVVEIEGEIDAEHSPQLKRSLAKAQEEKAKNFILDINKVSFLDSTGLGVMISLMRNLKEKGGELRLVGLQDEVRSIFEITRLYKVFHINSTVEDAIRDIHGEKG